MFAVLCKTLGVLADKLQGDELETDAESLTMALAEQLSGFDNGKERHAGLMDALWVLVSTGGGPWNPDRTVAYQLTKDGLAAFSFWISTGLFCLAGGDALVEAPSTALMTLLSPE